MPVHWLPEPAAQAEQEEAPAVRLEAPEEQLREECRQASSLESWLA